MATNFNNNIVFSTTSATAGNEDYTMLRTGRIYDIFALAEGAAAGTCTVLKGASTLSSVMDVNAADGTLARTASLDYAFNTFAIGDTLRVNKSAAVQTSVYCYLASDGVVV